MIPFARSVRLALDEVVVNSFRSLLMVLSVAVAVATLTIVTQMSATAERELAETVTRTQGMAGTVRVSIDDAPTDVQLAALDPDGIPSAAGRLITHGDASVVLGGGADDVAMPLVTVDPAVVEAFPNTMRSGRWLDERDSAQAMLPVVLSPQGAQLLREGLGEGAAFPLEGQVLRIDHPLPTYLIVTGVLDDGALVRGSDLAGFFVPLGEDGIPTPLRAWAFREGAAESMHPQLFLQDADSPSATSARGTAAVEQRLAAAGVAGAKVEGLRIDTAADFADATNTLTFMLRAIGLAVLAVGVTAVSIVSMMSLKERAGELALRRAVGTSPRSLAVLVVVENLAVIVLGALVGLGAATAGAQLLATFGTSGAAIGTVDLATATWSLGATVILGLLLSLVPARRAARHEIMDVLPG